MKPWIPINCPCKLCKMYIADVGYVCMMKQYTPRESLKKICKADYKLLIAIIQFLL